MGRSTIKFGGERSTHMDQAEWTLLKALDDALQSAVVRARIDHLVKEVAKKLAQDGDATMAWATIPMSAFDCPLPASIRSSWVFILRSGATTGAERHPNSHQRMMSYCGSGDLQTGGAGQWQSNLIRSEGDARIEDRWVSVPPNTWHQAVVEGSDWVVVSFHTVAPNELIEERPDPVDAHATKQRQYVIESEQATPNRAVNPSGGSGGF